MNEITTVGVDLAEDVIVVCAGTPGTGHVLQAVQFRRLRQVGGKAITAHSRDGGLQLSTSLGAISERLRACPEAHGG